MKQKLFCFGLGYSAHHLIGHLKHRNSDGQFSGTRRTASDDNTPVFDGTKPMMQCEERLSGVTHMLISTPPQGDVGDPVLYHHGADITQLKNLEWLGYLSTTGIYGDRGGDWVNDETVPAPTSTRGQQRLDAEQGWLKLWQSHNLPVHIFRLGSIYGPGRGQLASLLAGKVKKIIKQRQYFSRIHVDDIARVLMASMKAPNPGKSYNVVDDMPASTVDVIDYICDLLNRPHLPSVDYNDAEMSPMLKMFYSENKRVRNGRIKQELDVTLKYPTYKEGFSSLVRSLLYRSDIAKQ